MLSGSLQRSPESCPYHEAGPGGVSVKCRLLADLLVGGPGESPEVSGEICQACCRSFEPSPRDFNTVIASLVWSAAEQVLSAIEAECGEDKSRWQALLAKAESSLPAVLPDEDDLPLTPTVPGRETAQQTVDGIAQVLPLPVERVGQVTHWAVGVTTAPRRSPTLAPCLRSLIDAGWSQPHLFVDGEVEIPPEFSDLTRTIRLPAAGARQSYFLAITELLQRFPQAQALMLVQDDAYWPGHLPMREYLEQCLWPGTEPGLVSAWCCTDDTASEAGWHRRISPWKFGAVVFIFSRESAIEFVQDPQMQQLCDSRPENHSGGISMLVGNWAARVGVPVHFPTPSLVQHLGDISTIWENSRAVGVRRASRFLGDEVGHLAAEAGDGNG